jgi:LysR family nitrogen assimilation transcriptional regulator
MPASFDLRRLRYFVKVAELGSVTRAAEVLHVAQPALSQHMRALEAELGVQVLARGSRGVALTEAGERLYAEARELLGGIKAMVERVKDDTRDPEGEVVIGVGQTIGSILMVPLLQMAAERLPRVRIQIREVLSGLIPELVRTGAVDFALSYNMASGNGVEAVTVLSESMCLVGQRALVERHLGRRRAAGAEVRFAELAAVPLYLSRRTHILREMIEKVARRKGVALHLLGEVDSLYIMKELALGGTGCTVLSHANFRRELGHEDLFIGRITAPLIRRDICFVRRHGQALPRAARETAGLAAEALVRMVEEGVWRASLAARPEDLRRAFQA